MPPPDSRACSHKPTSGPSVTVVNRVPRPTVEHELRPAGRLNRQHPRSGRLRDFGPPAAKLTTVVGQPRAGPRTVPGPSRRSSVDHPSAAGGIAGPECPLWGGFLYRRTVDRRTTSPTKEAPCVAYFGNRVHPRRADRGDQRAGPSDRRDRRHHQQDHRGSLSPGATATIRPKVSVVGKVKITSKDFTIWNARTGKRIVYRRPRRDEARATTPSRPP